MTSQPVPEKVREQFTKLAQKTKATEMVRCHDVLIINFGPQKLKDVKLEWYIDRGNQSCKTGKKTQSTKST